MRLLARRFGVSTPRLSLPLCQAFLRNQDSASPAVRHEQVRECINHVVALSFEIVAVKVPANARIFKSLDPYRFFFQLVLAKLHEPPAALNSQVPSSLV